MLTAYIGLFNLFMLKVLHLALHVVAATQAPQLSKVKPGTSVVKVNYFAKFCTQLFRCLSVCPFCRPCHSLRFSDVCLSCLCSYFFPYSIANKTILPTFSPHLSRTFLTSIPSLLFLGSFRKTRIFFYFIFPIQFLLQTSHIPTVLPSQPINQCTFTTNQIN